MIEGLRAVASPIAFALACTPAKVSGTRTVVLLAGGAIEVHLRGIRTHAVAGARDGWAVELAGLAKLARCQARRRQRTPDATFCACTGLAHSEASTR